MDGVLKREDLEGPKDERQRKVGVNHVRFDKSEEGGNPVKEILFSFYAGSTEQERQPCWTGKVAGGWKAG